MPQEPTARTRFTPAMRLLRPETRRPSRFVAQIALVLLVLLLLQVDDPVFQQWFFLTRRHLQALAQEQQVGG